MSKFEAMVRSRRFWAAVGTLAAVVMNDELGIPEQDVVLIVGTVSAWLLGDTIRKTE